MAPGVAHLDAVGVVFDLLSHAPPDYFVEVYSLCMNVLS
jgi:hypothetical protein